MNASFHRALSRSAWSALALFAAPALAEPVFTVTSPIDAVDAAPGDGACASAAGACTLRAAIMEANRSSGVGATIVLPAGTYTLAIPATSGDGDDNGDLDLTTPASGSPLIHVAGMGAAATIIDANEIDRAFHVGTGRTATISGVTIRNGFVDAASLGGGGVFNHGVLTIANSVIEGNRTGGNSGGGIFNSTNATLSVTGTTVRANDAYLGGGLLTQGPTTIRDSTFHQNGAGSGGAVFVYGSTLYAVNSTFSWNHADGEGGGISSQGNAYLYNCSVIGNDADHDRDETGGIGGGIFANPGSLFVVVNTLIADNTVLDAPIPNNCNGALEAYGMNLLDERDGCTVTTSESNLGFVSPATIGALQDNGGPTPTHALLADSEAIDNTIDGLGCVNENGLLLPLDQRGAPRLAGARCDVGAFEFGATVPANDFIFRDGFEGGM
jgi:CSLREA domain-containing protein